MTLYEAYMVFHVIPYIFSCSASLSTSCHTFSWIPDSNSFWSLQKSEEVMIFAVAIIMPIKPHLPFADPFPCFIFTKVVLLKFCLFTDTLLWINLSTHFCLRSFTEIFVLNCAVLMNRAWLSLKWSCITFVFKQDSTIKRHFFRGKYLVQYSTTSVSIIDYLSLKTYSS